MFQQPAEGDRIDLKTVVGALALFYVREYREGISTTNGVKDAVACDVHILDGPRAGETFKNTLLFGGVLIGSLRSAIGGEPVLGRIGQGTAKPSQNPPWILNPFTQQDAAVATAYIQRMPQQFQAPAGAQPGPQPAAAAPAPAAAYPSPAAASPATGNYPPQPAPAQQYAPAPQAAPVQQYAPAPAPAQQYQPQPPAQSEANKFMGYPDEVKLVLIQSGQAPQLTQDQYNALPVPIQQALQPAAV